jgi:hypothetical protein
MDGQVASWLPDGLVAEESDRQMDGRYVNEVAGG